MRRTFLVSLVWWCGVGALVAQEEVFEPSAGASILRVNVTAQSYNFYQPWEKGSPSSRGGLGALVGEGKVLVTAQLVADATYIELELPDSGAKATARVEGIDYEANLALVSLAEDQPEFMEGLRPLELYTESKVGDQLEVWQVEDNGTPVSTSGELIRVETDSYFLDGTVFLTYRLKGSLQYREGSFTLPVVYEGKLAGLLLNYNSEQQTSGILAAPIIEHFLNDLKDGDYDGFPTLGLAFSETTDEQFRNYLQLDRDSGGVYVTEIVPESTASNAGVQVGDVLMALGGFSIDARGNYDHPVYGKLNLSHIARGMSYVGDEMAVQVKREGELIDLSAKMERKNAGDYLIDPYMFDRGPKFYIAGGLVFQELTLPYLKMFSDQWEQRAPLRLLHALAHMAEYQEAGREKIVFLSRVIRTPAVLGYEGLNHMIVSKVNGKEIGSLKDLSAAFDAPEDDLHKIEFTEAPGEIYLDAPQTEAVNQSIKEAFRVAELQKLD